MRIFCMVMLILFLVVSITATIGCVLEWNAKCETCDHEDNCNVTARARLYSAMTTIVLWVCAWCWMMLLIQNLREPKFEYEKRILGEE